MQDDPEYALDADGMWYDEAVEGDVMQDSAPLDALNSKKSRSRVSVCHYPLSLSQPLILFRNVHMSSGKNCTIKIIWMRFFDGQAALISTL